MFRDLIAVSVSASAPHFMPFLFAFGKQQYGKPSHVASIDSYQFSIAEYERMMKAHSKTEGMVPLIFVIVLILCLITATVFVCGKAEAELEEAREAQASQADHVEIAYVGKTSRDKLNVRSMQK